VERISEQKNSGEMSKAIVKRKAVELEEERAAGLLCDMK